MLAGEAVVVQPHERPAGFPRLMRNRNYALLWSGQLVSELGNRFHWVAVSLWIYALTGSAAAVSFAVSSMFAGSLLVSLWAGVIVDRIDRRRILIAADLVRAGLTAAIPLLVSLDIRLVYVDLILISVATAFFRPAVFAVVPAVVNRRDLLPANSFFSAMDNAADIAGPALAGLLAQSLGYATLLYVDAVTYAFSAMCVFGMHITPVKTSSMPRSLSPKSIWEGVREGIDYVRRDSFQWGLFILIFPSTLVGSGLNALQTPLAKGIIKLTDPQFGTFQSVWGAGFLVASLVAGLVGAGLHKSSLILGGFFLGFLSTAMMGLTRNFEQLMVTAFAVGFANTLRYVGIGTVLMERTPSDLVGRVISTRQLALGLIQVISPLVFGGLAETVGVRNSIVIMSLIGTAGTIFVLGTNPAIRRFDSDFVGNESYWLHWRSIAAPIDTDFDPRQQRRMNLITLVSATVSIFVLVHRSPAIAVGLLAIVIGLAYGGVLAKRAGRS